MDTPLSPSTTLAELLSSLGHETAEPSKSGEYERLHELVENLIDAIAEGDYPDLMEALAEERDDWAEHSIIIPDGMEEHVISATITFNAVLTVKAKDEDDALERAEEFINDEHDFTLSSTDDLDVDDYNYDGCDCSVE